MSQGRSAAQGRQASGKTAAKKAAAADLDHSDILEDDYAGALASRQGKSAGVTSSLNLDVPSSGLADLAAEGGLDEAAAATLGTAASLGNVASDLSQQLASITEEMNKIREELYGDKGIGGIAKELANLKAGSLGGLLEGSQSLSDLDLNASTERPTAGRTASSSRSDATRQASSSSSTEEAVRQRRPAAASTARTNGSRLSQEQHKEKVEEHFRALERKNQKPSVSFAEKLMLLFLVLVCLYIGSPFFRTAVKRAFSSMVGGREDEEEEEIFDY